MSREAGMFNYEVFLEGLDRLDLSNEKHFNLLSMMLKKNSFKRSKIEIDITEKTLEHL
jgi:hypothetical protein